MNHRAGIPASVIYSNPLIRQKKRLPMRENTFFVQSFRNLGWIPLARLQTHGEHGCFLFLCPSQQLTHAKMASP